MLFELDEYWLDLFREDVLLLISSIAVRGSRLGGRQFPNKVASFGGGNQIVPEISFAQISHRLPDIGQCVFSFSN